MDLLLIYTVLSCATWVMLFAAFAFSLLSIPLFERETRDQVEELGQWPRLSIIVPACNEEREIEASIRSLLKQDYPDLEIVAINDRSTDETGTILDQLAERDHRLQVIHIKQLPPGWLGKVNALHQGTQRASGDWLLFCDADIHFKTGALKRAIIFSLGKEIDHLALLPKVFIQSFWLSVCVTAFGLMFLLSARAALVNRPNSKTPIGVGAFNLVKRETFDRTPGFEWLRMEPGDDYGLGLMINRAGGKTHFALADKDLSVAWYTSVAEMFKGLEKNLFGPGAHYRWWRMVLMVLLFWALLAAPAVAIIAGLLSSSLPMLVASAVAIGIHVIFSILFVREKRSESLKLLLFPVGMLLFSLMFLWAGIRCLKNGGIDWRGTHYSLKELRAGQRVKF